MIIQQNNFEGSEFYSSDMRRSVEAVFQYAIKKSEVQRLIAAIKKESAELRNLFWTEAETMERQEAVDYFGVRMQSMVYYTLKNMEGYQQSGWREITYDRKEKPGAPGSL